MEYYEYIKQETARRERERQLVEKYSYRQQIVKDVDAKEDSLVKIILAILVAGIIIALSIFVL